MKYGPVRSAIQKSRAIGRNNPGSLCPYAQTPMARPERRAIGDKFYRVSLDQTLDQTL